VLQCRSTEGTCHPPSDADYEWQPRCRESKAPISAQLSFFMSGRNRCGVLLGSRSEVFDDFLENVEVISEHNKENARNQMSHADSEMP